MRFTHRRKHPILRQGIDLIRRLDDDTYSKENTTFSLNAAGCHFRHCIDFYNCFLGASEHEELTMT